MTVTSATARVSYAGDGSQTAFPVTFRFLANDHLRAILRDADGTETDWVLDTDYTLTGAGASAGGTLTAATAPASGETLVILRAIPLTQETDYVDNDDLPAETLEGDFDKSIMILQQFQEQLDRVIKIPESDSASVTLPTSTERAGKYLGFDSNGEPVAVNDPGDIVVSPFGEEIVNLADDEAAMDLIGTGRTLTAGDGLTGGGTLGADRTFAFDMAFVAALMRGHIDGLVGTNNATDANNDVDFAAGVATAGDETTVHVLASGITRQLDAAFGTGNGGLSSSLTKAANTTYHWILCADSSGAVTIGYDTDPDGANLVSDHAVTGPRRIGGMMTDGSGNIRAFKQRADEFFWTAPVQDLNAGSIGTTASTQALTVPTGIEVEAKITASVNNATATGILFTSLTYEADTAPSTTGPSHGQGSNGIRTNFELTVITNTSGLIRARASVASTTVTIYTMGWLDRRGRDA